MPLDPKAEDIFVGARLRELRVARNMSQTIVAKRVGITFQQIQKYETGANRISVSRLVELARIFQIPVSQFFAGLDNLKTPDAPQSASEMTLIENFRASGPEAQHSILRIAQETAQLCA